MDKIKQYINLGLSRFGVVLKQVHRLPEFHLFGLRQMDIQTIFDIGANEGQFASSIRKVFPKAQIISFEPVPSTFDILSSNAKSDPKWRVENFALGAIDDHLQMNVHTHHSASSSFLSSTAHEHALYPATSKQEKLTLPVRSLDSWVKSFPEQIDKDVLIKIDVQGYESSVLKGGPCVFSMAKAVYIEVLVQPLYQGQPCFESLITQLHEYGLKFQGVVEYGYDQHNHVVSLDALFFR